MEWILSIISIIISIIAILVSIYSIKSNIKINEINIQKSYFDEIYKDYLIKKIPKARSDIRVIGNKITGTKNMCNIIKDIKFDSLYYKYQDDEFYKNINDICQSLLDYIVCCENKPYNDFEQDEIFQNVNNITLKIEELYVILHQKLLNYK
ncbi:MAG: hypothetical protein ACLUCH_05415 [Lachnospirales bacterium]